MCLLACCLSNDQQILYTEKCLQDILNLNLTITFSKYIAIKDELRISKGDKPAAQFEAGQQKGGNLFYFSCSVHAKALSSLFHISKLPYMSLQNKIDHLLVLQASK